MRSWDENNWLSSDLYFEKLSSFLLSQLSIPNNSKILDVGCGRGLLIKSLKKNNQTNVFVGIDPISHKMEYDFSFYNVSLEKFLNFNTYLYDFIFFKQSIHLLNKDLIENTFMKLQSHINDSSVIIILMMSKESEIPIFSSIKNKFLDSISSHNYFINKLKKHFKLTHKTSFSFPVQFKKNEYLKMIEKRYMSILSNIANNELQAGIKEIDKNFKNNLFFNDSLNVSNATSIALYQFYST